MKARLRPIMLVLTAAGAAATGTALVALAPALWLRRNSTAAVLAGE